MVSDVLSDAVEQIKEYQDKGFYNGEAAFFVDQVKAVMEAVRNYLDWAPPSQFPEGIGWCVYCGNSDLNEEMKPSEMYKSQRGIDALVCSKCYELETILLKFREL